MHKINFKRIGLALFFTLAAIYNFCLLIILPFLYGASDTNPVDHSLAIIILWEVIYLALTYWAAIFAVKNIKKIKYDTARNNTKPSIWPYTAWLIGELVVFCLLLLTWDKNI